MSMTNGPVKLRLAPEVARVLSRLLSEALALGDGARVVDHFPINPWGDLDAFRREVFDPLHRRPVQDSDGTGRVITIAAPDVDPLRDVLDSLAEAISGGVPWRSLGVVERKVVDSVVDELAGGS